MESHAFDLAYAASLRQAKKLIITPLYQEPMLVLYARGSYHKGQLSPDELNPDQEIYVNWSEPFEIWHDQIWPKNAIVFILAQVQC